MLNVVLFEPEIPPNTGNIMRLCANTGCALHLIEPLGFELDDKRMRRAGLDYREFADVALYPDLDTFLEQSNSARLFGISTRGQRGYCDVDYQPGDALLFGPETRGLPAELLARLGPGPRTGLPRAGLPLHSEKNSHFGATPPWEGLHQPLFQHL